MRSSKMLKKRKNRSKRNQVGKLLKQLPLYLNPSQLLSPFIVYTHLSFPVVGLVPIFSGDWVRGGVHLEEVARLTQRHTAVHAHTNYLTCPEEIGTNTNIFTLKPL
ncbi:hypothetical protein XENORESO_002329 [Xenotaenia resolanae]|uniref:Uncharacterized protein n=1 Tax=Xenotaenia resolanae TaxID=208358 RepID=A0ABV0X9D2_9TELE